MPENKRKRAPSGTGGNNGIKRDDNGRILPGESLNPAGGATRDGGTRRASMRELFDRGPEIVREMIKRALSRKNDDKLLLALYERLIPVAPAVDPMNEKAESGPKLREWTVAEIKAQAGIQ